MRKALNIPLEEFLRPFFDPEEKVCLRIFDDRKTGTFKGAKLEAAEQVRLSDAPTYTPEESRKRLEAIYQRG